jgi:hypothetical protein
VYGADGELIGHVHDLRFEAHGPGGDASSGWRCRLTGIACGKRSPLGHRFGYGTGDMAGPWPLSAVFRRLRRRSIEIDWADVASFERPRVRLRHRRAHYERGRT